MGVILSVVDRVGGMGSRLDGIIEGGELVADALSLLVDRPSLLVYPLVGAVVSVLVALGGLAGLYLLWTFLGLSQGIGVLAASVLAVLVVTYLGVAFVNTLFIAALVHEVYDYHHGIPLSIVSGMRAAAGNWWPLFLWACINWTVGRLLKRRGSGDRRGTADRLMGEAVRTGYTAATFFVVPVVLFENARGRDMLQKSAGHFRDSWEEILGAVLGLRLVGWAIGSVGAGFGGLFFLGDLAIVALPIVVVFGVVGAVVTFSLQGVIKATVYEHLTTEDQDVADVVPSESPTGRTTATPEV